MENFVTPEVELHFPYSSSWMEATYKNVKYLCIVGGLGGGYSSLCRWQDGPTKGWYGLCHDRTTWAYHDGSNKFFQPRDLLEMKALIYEVLGVIAIFDPPPE